MSENQERLRPHPAGRFAGESHLYDLGSALQTLRSETHAAQKGHRQVTIFHRAPVAKVLFAFDSGGELADHAANGLVTIHALEGRFHVKAAEQTHELKAGNVLVLDSGVRHSVRAEKAGAMLLTVHLDPK